MRQKQLSTKEASPRLEAQYPQLAGILDDLDGFHKFILNLLWQFNLIGIYSSDEIISECILRWYKKVEKGASVPSIAGWMRLTALNIVREIKRENQKADRYDPTILEELVPGKIDPMQPEDEEQHQILHQAIQSLRPKQRELLELRFFHNLSWEQIAMQSSSNGKTITIPALRKRGERALEELRKKFLGMVQG